MACLTPAKFRSCAFWLLWLRLFFAPDFVNGHRINGVESVAELNQRDSQAEMGQHRFRAGGEPGRSTGRRSKGEGHKSKGEGRKSTSRSRRSTKRMPAKTNSSTDSSDDDWKPPPTGKRIDRKVTKEGPIEIEEITEVYGNWTETTTGSPEAEKECKDQGLRCSKLFGKRCCEGFYCCTGPFLMLGRCWPNNETFSCHMSNWR